MTRKILFYIVLPLFLATLLLTQIIYSTISRNTLKFHEEELLDFSVAILNQNLRLFQDSKNLPSLDSIFRKIDRETGKRITIIDTSGKVILDTREEPSRMDNHRWRPEVSEALKGNIGFSLRYSQTTKFRMLYCAIPVKKNHQISMVLRVSEPEIILQGTISKTRNSIILISSLLFILAILGLLILDLIYKRNIQQIITVLNEYSRNNLKPRIIRKQKDILSVLTNFINEMAEKLEVTFDELVSREAEIKSLFHAVPIPIAIVNEQRKIKHANEEFRKLFIKSEGSEEINLQDIGCSDLFDAIRNMFLPNSPENHEFTLKRGQKLFRVFVKKIKMQNHVLVIAIDITDTFEKEKIKKDLISYVSHDLRTPLTIIKGYTETALEECTDKSIEKYLQKIWEATLELQELVEKLNILSKLENLPEPKFEEIRIKEIVSSICEPFIHQARKKGLKFETYIETNEVIYLDPEKIKMILINLLDNAVKFTERGSIRVSITENSEYLFIEVSDTGPGIPEEYINKIFERFFTLDKSRGAGFGLGLAIVKHAVKALGGEIEVFSKINKGSTFKVKIPFVKKS
ncbi:MAG: ATP-binding protein [Candidatus Hydrothermia bacterium]